MATDAAVIGLACRFPGDADNVENFWKFICDKRTSVAESPTRWSAGSFHTSKKKLNASITRRAHYLKQDIAAWDADFFDISRPEAEAIDPQQRIFLEVVYEALENAGLPINEIAGSRTGVFAGSFTNDYSELVQRDPEAAPSYIFTGTNSTSTSNRVSYLFDLKGPSITLNTACSSSLVAVHLACQSLQTGDCDTAIVGGVNLLLNPNMFMHLSNQGFLAPDGQCKSFDSSGDGYGRGDGFAAIILRRADYAIQSEDQIRAVIRATGCNQDGKTRGFTLPSAKAQATLTQETYRKAGLDYLNTLYVEAHGTGTQAGDLEEALGLADTIAADRTPMQPLLIGSVKSNIGHLEGCAGLAGFVKSILVLERGIIPPTYGLTTPNPKVKWVEWNLHVPTDITTWPKSGVRRISCQGFGYGGTNAHAIIDDAVSYLASRSSMHATSALRKEVVRKPEQHTARLYILSTQDKAGLIRAGTALATHTAQISNPSSFSQEDELHYLHDLAQTLSTKRSKLQWSIGVVASTCGELIRKLTGLGDSSATQRLGKPVRVGFVFTGQGANWERMGHELMEFDTYRESIQAADRYLRGTHKCSWSIEQALAQVEEHSSIHEAERSQTLCTVLQVALVDLLAFWGIHPSAVVGHSSGEIAAAYCAGALTRADAWKIAYLRGYLCGRLKASCPNLRGAMLAVNAPPIELNKVAASVNRGDLSVACFNSPSSTTYAGDEDAIDQLHIRLRQQGLNAQKLRVDQAYHSPHMQAIAHEYLELIEDVCPINSSRNCIFYSSVHGEATRNLSLLPAFWVRNLISPVRFSQAIENMLDASKISVESKVDVIDALVEIGPHDAMRTAVGQAMQARGIRNLEYLTTLRKNQNCVESLLTCAGKLSNLGVTVAFRELNRLNANERSVITSQRRFLQDLPPYQWNHEKILWHENRNSAEYRHRGFQRHDLLGSLVPGNSMQKHAWKNHLRIKDSPWIQDHKIDGKIILPAAAYLAMAIEAVQQISGRTEKNDLVFKDTHFLNPIIFSDLSTTVEVFTELENCILSSTSYSGTEFRFTISNFDQGINMVNVRGVITTDSDREAKRQRAPEVSLQALQTSVSWYKQLDSAGLNFGPSFQRLTEVSSGSPGPGHSIRGCLSALGSPITLTSQSQYHLHPVYIDSILQAGLIATSGGLGSNLLGKIPSALKYARFNLSAPKIAPELVTASSTRGGMHTALCSGNLINFDGSTLVELHGLRMLPWRRNNHDELAIVRRDTVLEMEWSPVIKSIQLDDGDEATVLRNILLSTTESSHSSDLPISSLRNVISAVKLFAAEEPGSLRVLWLMSLSLEEEAAVTSIFNLESPLSHLYSFVTGELLAGTIRLKSDLATRGAGVPKLETSGPSHELCEQFDLIFVGDVRIESAAQLASVTSHLTDCGRLLMSDQDSANYFMTTSSTLWIETNAAMQVLSLSVARKVAESSPRSIKRLNAPSIFIIWSSKHDTTHPPLLQHMLSVYRTRSETPYRLVDLHEVTTHMEQIPPSSWVICAFELQTPFLSSLDQRDISALQTLFEKSSQLIWIQASNSVGGPHPHMSLVRGLSRVLLMEQPALHFVIFDTKRAETAREMNRSIDNLYFIVEQATNYDQRDREFVQSNGFLHYSRFKPVKQLNDNLHMRKTRSTVLRTLSEINACLHTRDPGMLDSLCFTQNYCWNADLDVLQVEIAAQAYSINAKDYYTIRGIIDCREATTALDFAGFVTRVGAGVTGLKPGDRVVCMAPTKFGTHVKIPWWACVKLTDTENFQTMCTVPVAVATAIHSLEGLARLQQGESVLIHSAAGGVGLAAIQIAKRIGAEIFATVGTDTKREYLIRTFGLKEDHIFSSRDTSLVPLIMAQTNNRGIDVILNSLSGDLMRCSWNLIAEFGRFVDISQREATQGGVLGMAPFSRSATYHAFDLTDFYWSSQTQKHHTWSSLLSDSIDLIRSGVVQVMPETIKIFSISDVSEAFRAFNSATRIGKIVVSLEDSTAKVPYLLPKYTTTFDQNKAYLMIGCLGGLGQLIARWIVQRGARYLHFLGRSGSSRPQTKAFVESLEAQGVKVEITCGDVTDYRVIEEMISNIKRPIRGVVHAAMILDEALFSRMTAEQWHNGIGPKVSGAWNLLRVIDSYKEHLDFFLMTSSVAGAVGSATESNYCAANAFLDQFAHHCRQSGVPAVSLGLGIISGRGYVHEHPEVEKMLRRKGFTAYDEEEILQLIDLALGHSRAHLFTGLELPTLQELCQSGFNPKNSVLVDTRASVFLRALEKSTSTPVRNGNSNPSSGDESIETLRRAFHSPVPQAPPANERELSRQRTAESLAIAVMSSILLKPRSSLSLTIPLSEYGMDSLLAVEVNAGMMKAFGVNLGINAFLDEDVKILDIVTLLLRELDGKRTE